MRHAGGVANRHAAHALVGKTRHPVQHIGLRHLAFHRAAEAAGQRDVDRRAASDEGERFEWRGSLSLEPVASKGNFKVEAFKAVSAYEFLSEELPFQLTDGSFGLSGDYDFSILGKSGPRLLVNLPIEKLDKLALQKELVDIGRQKA